MLLQNKEKGHPHSPKQSKGVMVEKTPPFMKNNAKNTPYISQKKNPPQQGETPP